MGQVNALTGGLGTYLSYGQNQARNSLLQQALSRNQGSGVTSGQGPADFWES
jgi:hypothetical protein